jgi:enamine deaminase RidA (YjgF/YER057c/UK114 family)
VSDAHHPEPESGDPPPFPAAILTRHHEGGSFEDLAGYSRGARRGAQLAVSGTTARGATERSDTYTQTCDALSRAIASIERLGGSRADILRSRIFLAPQGDWEQASRAHRELLGDVAPANTMLYVHALIGEGSLVEVELDAVTLG